MTARADDADLQLRAPVPAWVDVAEVRFSASADEASGQSSEVLLVDDQVRLERGQGSHYRRLALRALDQAGVDELGHLMIDFDPTHERVLVHDVSIWRAGVRSSRLAGLKFDRVQREAELEQRIYTGRQTASAFLRDVELGDVLDYAYTVVRDPRPVGGHHYGTIRLGWDVPVARLRARLSIAPGLELRWQVRQGAAAAGVLNDAVGHEWSVALAQVPATSTENDLPPWFDPYPRLEWSSFRDWDEVRQWALPLYGLTDDGRAALAPWLEEVRRLPDPEAQATEALALVRQRVRYVAVHVGDGAFRPTPPERVLEQRFGDCKAKALLLLGLLDGLGIPAQAALVHTELGPDLPAMLPSPGAFDHVIVRTEVGGRRYWLDPTVASFDPPLHRTNQPDFGHALVIAEQSGGLEAMNDGEPTGSRRIVAEIDASAGFEAPARLTVTTAVEGHLVEDLRAYFQTTDLDEIAESYRAYYAEFYRDLATIAVPEYHDESPFARVRVIEQYQIGDFWSRPSQHGAWHAVFELPEIYELLRTPDEASRAGPYWLGPLERHQLELNARLPAPWPSRSEAVTVEDPHFRFRTEYELVGQTLRVRHDFQRLRTWVAPEDLEAYRAAIGKVQDELELELQYRDVGDGSLRALLDRIGPNLDGERVIWGLVVLLLVFGLPLVAWGVARLSAPPRRRR
jgi:transglutaminase-like putative cysteine protease